MMTTSNIEQNDPSCIYGYISLVDDDTGEKYLLMSHDTVPPIPHGYPEFEVVFRQVDGDETRRVRFANGFGLKGIRLDPNYPNQLLPGGSEPIAYLYYITLVQDSTETGDPRYVRDLTQPYPPELRFVADMVRYTIRYNPERWRFDNLEMSPYHFLDPDGRRGGADAMPHETLSGWYSIPLHPREEPFLDLLSITASTSNV